MPVSTKDNHTCVECGRPDGGAGRRCTACGGRRIAPPRDLIGLTIAHIDCDAFYAAIEKRDAPELVDRPVIVGGGRRGVVTTACYIARTFGVRSAMPMFKALAACPDAVVVKPDFAKYAEAGRLVRARMRDLTPLVEPVSIDEAFLDLTGTERLHHASPAAQLSRLQRDIARDIGITVSVGLSCNKFLAKLASDLEKPEGFTVIGKDEVAVRLAPLPVSRIWGVGAVLEKRLAGDGIRLIGDLQKKTADSLIRRYGSIGGRLANLAWGRDSRPVEPMRDTKSVSAETTFNDDTSDQDRLSKQLWLLAEKVSSRMKEKNLAGRVVTLKLKTADFKTTTRRVTLTAPSNLARTLFEASAAMLASAQGARVKYRLIGVGYSDLSQHEDGVQPSFFEPAEARWRRQENAIDAIRARFGDGAISLGRGWGLRKLDEATNVSLDEDDQEPE